MTCETCFDTGWIYEVYGDGEVVKDGCPHCQESEEEARLRMTANELAQDDAYQELALRRAQPLKVNGSKGQWGTWRKRKAGSVARRARAGR